MPQPAVMLPESLAFYFGDRANRSALDIVMGSAALPDDLDWDEVPAFHDAQLTALKVKTDYVTFLFMVWQRTWGRAVEHQLPDAAPVGVADLGMWPPTVAAVWEKGILCRPIELPDGHTLWAAAEMQAEAEVSLAFYIEAGDRDYTVSDTLPLDTPWEAVDGDRWRRTTAGLAPVREKRLDLSPLGDAARDALALAIRRLTKPEGFLAP